MTGISRFVKVPANNSGDFMKKFDLILPAGAVCKTSQNLRQLKRQYESLPFDWILTPDLDKIHHLLANRFAKDRKSVV